MNDENAETAVWKPPANNPSNRDFNALMEAWYGACKPARRRFVRELLDTGALERFGVAARRPAK